MRESYLDGNYQELKLILDLSFDLITISNGSGIFTAASKSCEQYFGVSEQEIVGMGPSDLVASGVFDRSVTAQVISFSKRAGGRTVSEGAQILSAGQSVTGVENLRETLRIKSTG